MELEKIFQFLENKTILVTGATGFLGKMLVEKVLRVQPNVKKLYLLIRASDSRSAPQRMYSEIIGKELFRILREKWGTNFDSSIAEKVVPISGNISCDNLGLDVNDMEKLWKDIDVIVNSAAVTSFDGRYDVSLGTNTLGVLHVLSFAKKCTNLKMLVHVSTAYVCGERDGLILEDTMFYTGKTLKVNSKPDFKEEQKLMAEKLEELRDQNASADTITTIMRDFGIQRAKLYGWPNTYVFTKAMGEICLRNSKENFPLVIIRPTMVTSSYKEPFPGWIEGLRTIDSVIVGYGKGKIKCFLSKPKLVLDLIPGDMVINLILAAMAAHVNQSSDAIIYQIGSSLKNPIDMPNIRRFCFQYFTKNPLKDKKGNPVKVGKGVLLSNAAVLQTFMLIRFMLPLKILMLGSTATCQNSHDTHRKNKRRLELTMRLIELYKPYVLFNGKFNDGKAEQLRRTLRKSCKEMEMFNFDPKSIDWEDYIINTHIPGLVKYVIK